MISLRIVGNEVSALGTAALAMPLRFLLRGQPFDPHAPNPTPVVLVHGFLGDPTNFLALRSHLAARGIRNFVNFSYTSGSRAVSGRRSRRSACTPAHHRSTSSATASGD